MKRTVEEKPAWVMKVFCFLRIVDLRAFDLDASLLQDRIVFLGH